MEAKVKDIWVFVETDESGLATAGLELIAPAKTIAEKLGGAVVALIAGKQAMSAAADAAACGADKALLLENLSCESWSSDACTYVLEQLVKNSCPEALLLGASMLGRDLAGRLAARLETGVTTDVVAMDYCEEKKAIVWTKPVFAGAYMAESCCESARPQIALARANAFKVGAKAEGREAEIEKCDYTAPQEALRSVLREVVMQADEGVLSVEDAQVVVAGGRGVGSAEGFDKLWELAKLLGGTVGCSRPVCDSDWMAHSSVIGQTGKTIAPRLYIACGISGAMQHTCGMADADCIIAINRDPDAPIFSVADFGIVGDLHAVVPALIEEIKKLKG